MLLKIVIKSTRYLELWTTQPVLTRPDLRLCFMKLNTTQIFIQNTRNSWTLNCKTSPNLRFCFIKRAHRRTLLEGFSGQHRKDTNLLPNKQYFFFTLYSNSMRSKPIWNRTWNFLTLHSAILWFNNVFCIARLKGVINKSLEIEYIENISNFRLMLNSLWASSLSGFWILKTHR